MPTSKLSYGIWLNYKKQPISQILFCDQAGETFLRQGQKATAKIDALLI
jgi:hypothetical protein